MYNLQYVEPGVSNVNACVQERATTAYIAVARVPKQRTIKNLLTWVTLKASQISLRFLCGF